jgi:hypothetical protein
MKIFGTISELVKVAFRLSGGKEVRLEVSATQSGSGPVVVTIPNVGSNAANLVTTGDSGTITSTMIQDGTIVNDDISLTAAIDATKIANGTVDNTEFSYLNGVTSAIQTQINSKQATITGAATTITSADLTASKALQSDASGKVSASTVTSTELGYVSGVTSAIQTQLGNKASSGANSDITSLSGLTTPLSSGQGGTGINNGGTLTYGANNISLTTSGATSLTLPTTGTVTTTSNKLSAFASTSSSELAGVISDETGSGSLVFGTSPTLSSPQVNSSLVVQQIATPSNPSAGFDKLYTKSDGILYKLDSAGNEVAVGSGAGGSGEINTVTNPSAATDTTGWAAGTSHSVAKDTSNSPLNPVVPTSFGISSSAAVTLGAQTSTSGVYDAITMPSGLQNRKLKVEFFFTTPASSSGTWAVAVYQGSTKVALSTDSSGDTILPAGVTGGKFTAYFDTISAASYSVNLVQRTRSLSNALYITNVVCGPGIQPQGAVVGEWTSYTPTFDAFGAVNNIAMFYRRVGSSLHIQGCFRPQTGISGSQAYFTLPTGLTIDTSKLATLNYATSGRWYRASNATANSRKSGDLILVSNRVYFGSDSWGDAAAPANAQTGAAIASVGDDFQIADVTIPIAEWAGSGTVQLAQNDVEYAYNTSISTTSDNASFGYGPQGALIQAFAPSGTNSVDKRVRFQSPIQPGDQIVLETDEGSGGARWVPFNARLGAYGFDAATPTIAFGTQIRAVNSTDVDVQFYSRLNLATTNTWSVVSSHRWRVRKSSAGAAVGFGLYQPGVSAGLVSSSGLAGRANGLTVPTGYVGEVSSTTLGSNTAALSTAGTATTVLSLPLTPGVWRIKGSAAFAVTTNVTSVNSVATTITTGSTFDTTLAADFWSQLAMSGTQINNGDTVIHVDVIVNVATSTTYNFLARAVYSGGGIIVRGGSVVPAKLAAVRIA